MSTDYFYISFVVDGRFSGATVVQAENEDVLYWAGTKAGRLLDGVEHSALPVLIP
jgi:hypothetical protein